MLRASGGFCKANAPADSNSSWNCLRAVTRRVYCPVMEQTSFIMPSEGASDAQIAVLLGASPISIIDSLMEMPLENDGDATGVWKRVVERRLADRLRAQMERSSDLS